VVSLQGGEKSLMISLSVSIQYRRMTDRWTCCDNNSHAMLCCTSKCFQNKI